MASPPPTPTPRRPLSRTSDFSAHAHISAARALREGYLCGAIAVPCPPANAAHSWPAQCCDCATAARGLQRRLLGKGSKRDFLWGLERRPRHRYRCSLAMHLPSPTSVYSKPRAHFSLFHKIPSFSPCARIDIWLSAASARVQLAVALVTCTDSSLTDSFSDSLNFGMPQPD